MDRIETGSQTFALVEKDGVCLLKFAEGDGVAVRVVRARPLSGKDGEVAFLDSSKKVVAMIPSVAALDKASQDVARRALGERYMMPRINRVDKTWEHFGIVYWDVNTDWGNRQFAVRSAHRNVVRVTADHLYVRDVIGNLFEIASLEQLDPESRRWVELVI